MPMIITMDTIDIIIKEMRTTTATTSLETNAMTAIVTTIKIDMETITRTEMRVTILQTVIIITKTDIKKMETIKGTEIGVIRIKIVGTVTTLGGKDIMKNSK